MSGYSLGPEVRDDLREIYRYIARDNPAAARRVYDGLIDKFRTLSAAPLLGEGRPDLAPDVRMFTAGNYVIFYRPTKSGIIVDQVVHAARDLDCVFRRPS